MLDLTGVFIDLSDYLAIAAFLIAALVAYWGIKKGLALLNMDSGNPFTESQFDVDYWTEKNSPYNQDGSKNEHYNK